MVLILLWLVFTTAGVAFAETGDAQTAADSKVATAAKSAAVVKAAEKTSVKATTSGSFALTTLKTGSDSEFEQMTVNQFAFNSGATLNTNYKGMSNAVTIPAKGTVMIYMAGYAYDAAGTSQVDGNYMYYGLFYDAACTNPVDSSTSYGLVDSTGVEDYTVFTVPAAGTYYIGVYTSIYSSSAGQIYAGALAALYMNGADRTLTNKTWTVVGQKNSQTNYLKFKASKSGYVRINTSGLSGTITLMNSGKSKSYSEAISFSDTYRDEVVFGVKKGTTYYLKVKANSNYDGGYRIKYANGSISEKSGKTKSKAVTIKKGSTKKGYIYAGSSQADWYKFKLTSSKKVTITVKGGTNDRLKIAVYKGSKRIAGTPQTFWSDDESLKLTSNGKFSKGTYYIKVYRGNSKSSGYYTLKWK